MADALGCALPPVLRTGDPYIVAVDVTDDGPQRLKRYHLLPAGAADLDPAWGTPAALQRSEVGHILQTRSADRTVKVYGCYPYRDRPDSRLDAHRTWEALRRSVGLSGRGPLVDSLPEATAVTSIGVRVVDGLPSTLTYYAAEIA